MRRFGTQGRVYPEQHYIVSRSEEIADFLTRIKEGRYIVLFAPRQTGKTTFFRSGQTRCIHSVGIIGVKSITQLNYDRSVFPFNIQDEFSLPNFSLQQVAELLVQYTDETVQPFSPEVIEALHKQTTGQPFLVNRLAQILTEELEIPSV